MSPRLQFVRGVWALLPSALPVIAGFSLAALFLVPRAARAQQAPPPGAVASVEGNDVSVESGTAASSGTATTPPRIYVTNGGVVTVHSGPARMTLFDGGQVDICGPAKLTVLQSNGAMTLALNFGHLHVELPPDKSLRIFTPTMIATPLEISGGKRDITVGLNLDDSLCVLATSGALQLEQQFSGEKLIVPQAGEFFLNGGKLVPVAGAPASCQCSATRSRSPSVGGLAPEFADAPLLQAPPEALAGTIPTQDAQAPTIETPVGQPGAQQSVQFSVPTHANEAHPILTPVNASPPSSPPNPAPIYTLVAPLTFSASAPVPPEDPTPDMALLIREARVLPEWEFSGRVAAPEFAIALQQALGETSSATGARPAGETRRKAPKKKGGFWAALKRLFQASGSEE